MSRNFVIIAVVATLLAGVLIYQSPPMRDMRFVNALIARNLDARGGADAWGQVTAMRMAGQMDLGQEMIVPYVLVQKRPGKMCLEFDFNNETSTQCTDGEQGWKVAPFRGRSEAEPMTLAEYREAADSSDPYGLLYDHENRGVDIEFLGTEQLGDRAVHKLRVDLPRGGVRWLYLDAETALEVKLEAPRVIASRDFLVETLYTEWQEIEGLLIPARQETRTVGDEESHFLTVDSVTVNPDLADDRFDMPATLGTVSSNTGGNAS